MINKIKAFIAIGGTGGHVFPGCNLAEHLIEKNYNIKLITDKRGKKFLKKYENFDISILPSSRLNKKNIIYLLLSLIFIFYSVFRSLIFLIFNRPKIIFGMGGYSSFPICLAASILKIKFIIYENNLILGKANRYLIPFAYKICVAFKELDGIPEKYKNKIVLIGNIIKKDFINYFSNIDKFDNFKKINILVLGGSQAAKVFAETLPNIFKECSNKGIPIKIFQHCLPEQNKKLKDFYEKNNLDFEIFNFSHDLLEYFSKVNLAITRSGSSMLAELTNANIPFISVPLPSSADNHQLKNAMFYQSKKFSFLIEEKELNNRLLDIIQNIFKNNTQINEILFNQKQYSDKYVYNNIDLLLEKIINEKN